ncbi:MAG: hypothetical protein PUG48_07860 [Clostridia bacterium]|nr:hypothetical protein [Clostridia bacterium]
MMKYLKIAYNMFVHKLLFNVILIIEIAALIILSNVVIASYNSKSMLYKPYEDILNNNEGVAVYIDSDMPFTEEDMDNIRKNLEGDVRIITTDILQSMLETEPSSKLFYDYGKVDYILLDSDVLSKLRLPLLAGRWCSSELNSQGQIEVVASGGIDTELNKVYHTDMGDVVVVGILTDNTYQPVGYTSYAFADNKKSIFGLFRPFDSNVSTVGAFLLGSKSLFANANPDNWNIICDENLLISYGSDVSDEVKKKNNEYLKTVGTLECDFSEMVSESKKEMNNDLMKMLPIILVAVIVVLSGLTGSVAISTMKQVKNFGIFFLCGCRWKDCFKIISANVLIVFVLSGLLTVGGIVYMQLMNFNYLIGASFELNNLLISIGIMAFMFLMSIILPYAVIRSTSPVETIKENAE